MSFCCINIYKLESRFFSSNVIILLETEDFFFFFHSQVRYSGSLAAVDLVVEPVSKHKEGNNSMQVFSFFVKINAVLDRRPFTMFCLIK